MASKFCLMIFIIKINEKVFWAISHYLKKHTASILNTLVLWQRSSSLKYLLLFYPWVWDDSGFSQVILSIRNIEPMIFVGTGT